MVTLNTDFPVQLKAMKGILATVFVTLPHMLIVFNLVCCHFTLAQPLTKIITANYSMEHSLSWEASSFLASQEIPRV